MSVFDLNKPLFSAWEDLDAFDVQPGIDDLQTGVEQYPHNGTVPAQPNIPPQGDINRQYAKGEVSPEQCNEMRMRNGAQVSSQLVYSDQMAPEQINNGLQEGTHQYDAEDITVPAQPNIPPQGDINRQYANGEVSPEQCNEMRMRNGAQVSSQLVYSDQMAPGQINNGLQEGTHQYDAEDIRRLNDVVDVLNLGIVGECLPDMYMAESPVEEQQEPLVAPPPPPVMTKQTFVVSHLMQSQGGAGKPAKGGSNTLQVSRVGSYSKDEETQQAQAKLRQYEALGLIKVEVDEPTEEESRESGLEQIMPVMHQQLVGLPVSNSQPLNTFQLISAGNNLVPLVIQPSSQMSMAQQEQALIGPVSQKGGGVVDVPALTDMEGEYGFDVTIEEKERTTKSPMWLMSKITHKLYTNINKAVPFEIHLKKRVPSDQFRLRAVAVFSSAQFLRTNVTRCPNHASPADITNHDFPYPAHVVRADHPEAQYDESTNGRLSVVVPLDILQDGSDYTPILLRFMCLGSCVGGINRRPIAIILTLENNSGQICGRKVIDVRVCACPTRDIKTDEVNKGVKRRASTLQEKTLTPIRKKPRSVEPKMEPEEDNKTYYLPVPGRPLFQYLSKMMNLYLESHPEYAAKYAMDTSFQMDDESEDELKSNTLQGYGDSETVNWDSGGNYAQHVTYDSDARLEIINGPKNNSPLSKLTPNISISPSPAVQLRLWQDDSDLIGCSQEEDLEYQHAAKASDIISSSRSVSNSRNLDSVPFTKLTLNQSQVFKNIDTLSKHIPVMQVQSYKPGALTVKSKPMSVLKHNYHNPNGEAKGKKMSVKKNSRETAKHLSFDPPENLYQPKASDDYLSPGSPEMLAANVLVEGFKSKTIVKQ